MSPDYQWTKELPKVTGYYWIKNNDRAEIVDVYIGWFVEIPIAIKRMGDDGYYTPADLAEEFGDIEWALIKCIE